MRRPVSRDVGRIRRRIGTKNVPNFLRPAQQLRFDSPFAIDSTIFETTFALNDRPAELTGFVLKSSQAFNWCWATVAQAVNAYKGRILSQTQIAQRHIGPTCSASAPITWTTVCNTTGYCPGDCNALHDVALVLRQHGINVVNISSDMIRDCLLAKRPVIARIRPDDNPAFGHFIVIYRHRYSAGGKEYLDILFPTPDANLPTIVAEEVRFSEFANQFRFKGRLYRTTLLYVAG